MALAVAPAGEVEARSPGRRAVLVHTAGPPVLIVRARVDNTRRKREHTVATQAARHTPPRHTVAARELLLVAGTGENPTGAMTAGAPHHAPRCEQGRRRPPETHMRHEMQALGARRLPRRQRRSCLDATAAVRYRQCNVQPLRPATAVRRTWVAMQMAHVGRQVWSACGSPARVGQAPARTTGTAMQSPTPSLPLWPR